MEEKKEQVLDALLELIENGDRQVITMFNDYLEAMKYYDDILLPYNDGFWNMTYSTPAEAANAAIMGDINSTDEYVKFDGNGHPETRNYYTATEEIKSLYLDEFIDWAIETDYFDYDDEDDEY